MRPFWTRAREIADKAKIEGYKLKGLWLNMFEIHDNEKKILILILRQLSSITNWLAVITLLLFVNTCQGVFE